MVWIQTLIVGALLAATSRGSQEHVVSYGQTEERIVGLLEIQDIRGDLSCNDVPAHTVGLYPEPSKLRPSSGTIEVRPSRYADSPHCYLSNVTMHPSGVNPSAQALPSGDIGYEMRAAVVYERKG